MQPSINALHASLFPQIDQNNGSHMFINAVTSKHQDQALYNGDDENADHDKEQDPVVSLKKKGMR